MKKFVICAVAALVFAGFSYAGEKSQAAAPAKAQAPAPVKAQDAAPVSKGQAPSKGVEVTKKEIAVPLTNREKKALDLYKNVTVVTVAGNCCDNCSNCANCSKCNPPKGGLFSRLRAKRTATVVCENCSK